jgi:hypothetical protein
MPLATEPTTENGTVVPSYEYRRSCAVVMKARALRKLRRVGEGNQDRQERHSLRRRLERR